MQFFSLADGTVTVDELDDEITITLELLYGADKRYLRADPARMRVEILGAPYFIKSIDRTLGVAELRRVADAPTVHLDARP